MGTVDWVRCNRAHPCPVCGRTHYCSVSVDGGLVYCTRAPSNRLGSDGAGWLHKMNGHVNGHSNGHARPRETRYGVRDANGAVVAVHVRLDTPTGKRLWWEMPDGTKKLVGMGPADLPLYGIDRIEDAHNPIFLVEGEKAADAVWDLGLPGVGTVTGAGTADKNGNVVKAACPNDEVLRPIADAEVCLWPDNDEIGRAHMRAVARRLVAMGCRPRILVWPEAPAKGDAADFVARGLGRDELRAMYLAAEVVTEVEPATETPPQAPAIPLTDVGNARRLVARHGDDIRWCDAMGRWFRWSGARWTQVGPIILQDLAVDTVTALAEQARVDGDIELAKWAKSSASGRAIASMVTLAKTVLGPIAVDADALDADPMLLGVENGVVDLRTGLWRPAERSDLITKACRAAYDDEATCPLWDAFLDRIFGGDAELIGYVQRAVGYSLTGRTGERVIFINHGAGANGKTTFQEVIGHILGTYAMSTPVETLIARKDRGIPNDLARLKSARFVSATESERGAKLAEAFIKAVTGGDRITARFLHQEFFDFTPQLKLWLATNHRPEIASGGKAVWSRIRLIPFEVEIPEDERDPDLKAKLLAEAPGILLWMIRGCLDWQEIGLKEPASISDANRSYEEDEDVLGAFLEDRAIVEPNVWVSAADLYAEFEEWREAHGEERLSAKAFSQAMAERTGIRRQRQGGTGTKGFNGLRLLTNRSRKKQVDGLDD